MSINLLPHEISGFNKVKLVASECTLFFKRDKSFPIKEPCSVVLIGSGVRHTVKGGTGSGDVNSRYFMNIEDAFTEAGFDVTSSSWLKMYDEYKKERFPIHIARVKKEAKELGVIPAAHGVGKFNYDEEFDFNVARFSGDIAIYVLSRDAGEGHDRELIKGDVYLTDGEIRDILYLNEHFEKFMLVLNVSGVVDLEPLKEVRNILYLGQLGVATSQTLVDIILGKTYPSGKLSTTWTKIKDYECIKDFGDYHNTRYIEGIYVGYRYFDINKIDVSYPFGFGLGYTDFKYEYLSTNADGLHVNLKVKVTNIGEYPGKEVIQVYLSSPKTELDKPEQILCAFKKTKELQPSESEILDISFRLSDFPNYSVSKQAYILESGFYSIKVGNSSRNLTNVIKLKLNEELIVKQVKNQFVHPDFVDLKFEKEYLDDDQTEIIVLDSSKYTTKVAHYCENYQKTPSEFVMGLSVDELIHLSVGDYKSGISGMIGQSCSQIPGGAGETSLRVKDLPSLSMVDGPAGLRVINEFIVTPKGVYEISEDSIWKQIKHYLPSILVKLLDKKKNEKKKGTRVYQLTTAIPVATALAQSFNPMVLYEMSRLVSSEMNLYNVDIWLAPALNIHRSILCGRNFEYYSEDPYLSAICASSIVTGAQENSSHIVTIKHFCCNNQETNRTNNNSMVSERALREFYLYGFEKTIEWSNPHSIMTSYNLVNDLHTSQNKNLVTHILRDEWKYDGLVMSDWIKTGQLNYKKSIYPGINAYKQLLAGVNLTMPGAKSDIKDIKKALKRKEVSLEDLRNNAEIVYSWVLKVKNH